MTAAASTTVRPGRQRSQAADEAILSATLELLSDRGYGGFTVSGVIERAGVSSATLYRRWPTKQQLVAAAVASIVPQPTAIDTGSLKGDLRAFLVDFSQSIAARREDIAEGLGHEIKHTPELAAALREKFLVPRLEELEKVLSRAVQRGELTARPTTEVAYSLVVGPIYHRAFVMMGPLTSDFLADATLQALRGLGGRES